MIQKTFSFSKELGGPGQTTSFEAHSLSQSTKICVDNRKNWSMSKIEAPKILGPGQFPLLSTPPSDRPCIHSLSTFSYLSNYVVKQSQLLMYMYCMDEYLSNLGCFVWWINLDNMLVLASNLDSMVTRHNVPGRKCPRSSNLSYTDIRARLGFL